MAQPVERSQGVVDALLDTKYGQILYENRTAYVLLIPTLLFLLVLVWIPFVQGIWMSFHEWPLVGEPKWVGLANYEFVLAWDAFYISLRATAVYLVTVLLQLGLALVAALTITSLTRYRGLIDGVFILPYTLAPVVAGAMWLYVLEPDIGPVFRILTSSGILEKPIYWGSNGPEAMAAIVLATGWQFWPFMYLIFLPTLQSIPDAHYELADIYGAGRLDKFVHITLPQLKSAILVAVSIRIVWNLAKVSLPLEMTQGGPGWQTSILGVFIYRLAIERGTFGMAYVPGIVLVIISMLLVGVMINRFESLRGERL